ncbi:hypothetical protein N6B72_21655 [Chryseobacterium soli]|uniref:hypothetical protein n=1 Tax=Chryseobacterium soli TaxID=445961 RepID=UPI0029532DB0|nr:hypothetical protein [Chryseobacterium soli]MDV7699526.1 hypothetical protein [Chryseobacterium soli]
MKNTKIKKSLKFLGLVTAVIINNNIKAQQEINFGDNSRPVPSVSSLATYNNTPMSVVTGMPGLSVPLFELPTKTKRISIPLALAYNSANLNVTEAASDVGAGWSLFAGGVISREIIDGLNEQTYNDNPATYSKEELNDIFYYNLPGISGKFRLNRNLAAGTIDIENLSPNKVKISFIRQPNPLYFTIASFTITDEKGYKYIFNDYSEGTNYASGIYQYRSAFFLSQIKLADDTTVASFEYRKDSKHETEEWTSNIVYTSCKLAKINSEGQGSISIDYQYDNTLEKTMNDPYSISQILLKDARANVISGYKFNYSLAMIYQSTWADNTEEKGRRLLNKLIKINKNLAEYEKTSFVYNPFNNYLPYEDYNAPGLLRKMIHPTGGITEYNYEPNEYFFDRNSPEYLNNALTADYMTDPLVQELSTPVPVVNIDTNQSLQYTLSIPGTADTEKTFFLELSNVQYYPPGTWIPDPTPDPDDQPAPGSEPGPGGHYHFELNFTVKKDGVTINPYEPTAYRLKPGNYTVTISGTGGQAQLLMSQIKLKDGPYPNKNSTYKYGPRIKNIKHYNSSTETQPVKTEQYNYAAFNDPNSSSGYIFRNESEKNNLFPGYILYKNVSVTDGENGFVRYYFKTPDDYPKTPYTVDGNTTSFWPYYTITKSGVPQKKEVYNAQNQLVSSDEYESEFETLQNLPDLKIEAFDGIAEKYTKPAYVKNTKTTTKTFAGTRQSKSVVETVTNPYNFQAASMKEISSDGITTEKWMRYASDKNKTQLINANMVSVPLETETKVNGKSIDKVETLYDNAGRFDPLSVIVSNTDNGISKTTIKYEAYDSYGNLQQYSVNINEATGQGFPSVAIWGYNQTLPIAKIEGAKLSDIGNLAADIIAKSNADKDDSTETELINALDVFRSNAALKNFQIITYTYDPLVGITTVTPADGIREIYKYDQNGRLKSVIDVNGNILKEYKYNKKPQP